LKKEKENTSDLVEIAKLFLKLGLTAFGGPAAHIAMFEDEVVTKRNWMNQQHFLDLIGATNLIPGPNSTEMALHIGYHKGKIPGLIAAGLCFMFPAILLTGLFAYLYVLYGKLPQVEPFLYGIKPAVIIIILNAVYKLGKKAVRGWNLIVVSLSIGVLNFIGLNEIFSILSGGIFGALFLLISEKKNRLNSIAPFAFILLLLKPLIQVEKSEVSLMKLFLTFLKIGTVWFGSGYILVAYFNGELVQGLHWLTRKELLDAIAVGQFTPGPFLSSATFIGYQIDGIPGAIIATVGIVIPSIIFVLILNPLVPRLRKSIYLSKFLDAVNVSSLAVMFVVAIKLGAEVLIDWRTILIAVFSAVAFLSEKKMNSAYIVLGGAVLGYLLHLFH
jgi:chromate transporter